MMAGAVLLGVLLAGCGGESKAQRHAEDAEKSFNSGDYNRAEIDYKNLLRADASNVHALRRMGTIWQERGSPLQAARYFARARKLAPGDRDIGIRLARALHAAGEWSGARKEAHEVLAGTPGDGDALVLLALTAVKQEEVAEISRLLEAAGDSGDAAAALAPAFPAMRRGDLPAVGAAIEKSLALDPKAARTYVYKADWHRARNEAAEAEKCFQEALRLAPPRSPERIAYASFLMAGGKRDAAVEFLTKATADTPDFLSAWRLLAQDAIARKDYPGAGKFLANVFAKDALDYEAALLQCRAWLSQGDPKDAGKAVGLMEKLREAYPGSPMVEAELARAHIVNGTTGAAAEGLGRVLKDHPEFRDAVLMKAALEFKEGLVDETAKAMEAWLEGHPGDAKAGLLLVDAYRAQGRPEDALKVLKALADQPGADSQSHFRLGLVLGQQQRFEEARRSFEKAVELDPANLPAVAELVKQDMRDKNPDAAMRRVDAEIARHPESALPYYLRATVLAVRADWSRAEEDLKTAVRLDPGMVAAYELMVKIHAATGKKAEAQAQLERVREIDPGNVTALMTLGGIHQAAGDKAKARECYEEVLKRQPSFLGALNNLAVICAESPGEDLDRARKLAEDARSLKPGDPAIADTLGWILFKQGEFKRAHDLLKEAADGLPDEALVKFHLGMACRAMGDEAAAREALRQAIATLPEFPGRPDAVACLARLEATAGPGDEGVRMLTEQVRQDPADVVARLRLAALLDAAGRSREAADAYAAAAAVNPGLHRVVSRLAQLYAGPLKDPAKAAEQANRARELVPGDPHAAAILGRQAFVKGEHGRADGLFQESLAKITDDPSLMAEGARAAYSVGRIDAAKELMEAAAAKSADPGLRENGERFLALLKSDCPVATIDAALAADPADVPARVARAARAEKSGQATVALEGYEGVLEIYPEFTPAREAVERLRPASGASGD